MLFNKKKLIILVKKQAFIWIIIKSWSEIKQPIVLQKYLITGRQKAVGYMIWKL